MSYVFQIMALEKAYFKSKWNLLDFVLLVLSLVDLILEFTLFPYLENLATADPTASSAPSLDPADPTASSAEDNCGLNISSGLQAVNIAKVARMVRLLRLLRSFRLVKVWPGVPLCIIWCVATWMQPVIVLAFGRILSPFEAYICVFNECNSWGGGGGKMLVCKC